ncbi:MAG: hypothetical protein LBP33_08830 [Candidatus Adiutrix sp.]|jgi:hypothetical protein|nr:hypothetical protein [Candidatus Adiutrix sp.]
MLVSSGNYNVLGKIGPHYERPEYRPPENQAEDFDQPSSLKKTRGDRSSLSVKNTDVPAKEAPAGPPGKVTLSQARELTEAAAARIRALPPLSTGLEPHRQLPTSLMTPVYA